MVGRLMKRASWIVRGIVMDAHQSNSFVRGGIFGDFSSLSPKILEDIPWFQDLKHVELPKHALPHLDLKLAYYEGEPVWLLPGVCSSFLRNGVGVDSVAPLGFEWFSKFSRSNFD